MKDIFVDPRCLHQFGPMVPNMFGHQGATHCFVSPQRSDGSDGDRSSFLRRDLLAISASEVRGRFCENTTAVQHIHTPQIESMKILDFVNSTVFFRVFFSVNESFGDPGPDDVP